MDINVLADKLIGRITKCIEEENRSAVKIDPAIVSNVHSDGTVDIYFPPDNDKILTHIQNQSIHTLGVGDGVEVLMPRGKLTNCWIIAKHNKT